MHLLGRPVARSITKKDQVLFSIVFFGGRVGLYIYIYITFMNTIVFLFSKTFQFARSGVPIASGL